jgi:phosphatidylserine/phosphatidylglycerophosphate/cardiolipin synthase-like enzyme
VPAIPLVPGDVALDRETRLIREIATGRGGWVYIANWYAGLATRVPLGGYVLQPALWSYTQALVDAARANARVRMLLWDGSMRELDRRIAGVTSRIPVPAVFQKAIYDTLVRFAISKTNHDVNSATKGYLESLSLPDLAVRLDDETLPVGSHHQKLLVVGNNERTVAIVGGIDLNRNRVFPVQGSPGTPYFDVAVQLEGEAAADVAKIFEDRWQANPDRRSVPLASRRRPSASSTGGATVQIGVNFGCGRPHRTIGNAVRGADRLIKNVLVNCQTFFYAEDQYGVGNDELADAIRRAFANGARYGVVVLADALGVDDLPEVEYRRHRFWTRFPQVRDGRLLVFQRRGDDGTRTGPHAYVHSKLVIVDDQAATIGSVNMNRRSWYYDSEIAAAISDNPDVIRALRIGIWRQHLKPRAGEVGDRELADPLAAFRLWQEAYAKSAPWYDVTASTVPRPRLSAITFDKQPPRTSERIIRTAKATASDVPLIGGVTGWAAGTVVGSFKGLIDDAFDYAYDNLFDPSGPVRCP